MKLYILIFLSFLCLTCNDFSPQKKVMLKNNNEVFQNVLELKLHLITVKKPLEKEIDNFLKKIERDSDNKKSKKSVLVYMKNQDKSYMDILLAYLDTLEPDYKYQSYYGFASMAERAMRTSLKR